MCVWGVGGCVTSLWPGLHLSNQTVCLLAPWGAGCRRSGSGVYEGGSLPGVPAPSRHLRSHPTLLCCRLVLPCLVDDLASPDPVETAGIFTLHPSSVPLVVQRSSLAGPMLRS